MNREEKEGKLELKLPIELKAKQRRQERYNLNRRYHRLQQNASMGYSWEYENGGEEVRLQRHGSRLHFKFLLIYTFYRYSYG